MTDRSIAPLDLEGISNIVIHAGDTIVVDPFSGGRYEYRLFDAAKAHYATLVGHHNDDGHFVIDAIRFVAGRPGVPR